MTRKCEQELDKMDDGWMGGWRRGGAEGGEEKNRREVMEEQQGSAGETQNGYNRGRRGEHGGGGA